jgi:cytochrome c553
MIPKPFFRRPCRINPQTFLGPTKSGFGVRPKPHVAICVGALIALAGQAQPKEEALPDHLVELAWAYAIETEPNPPFEDHCGTYGLPGTSKRFNREQIIGAKDGKKFQTAPVDWFPQDHPEMPEIYAYGDPDRKIIACALCHYPNGKGKAENAPPAGQNKDYLVQQLLDFKNGLRKSAEPRKTNCQLMIDCAVGMTEEEIEAVSEYMASMAWMQWIQVVETDTVPKTRIRGGLHIPLEGGGAGTEPIGNRIIETPIHSYRTEFLRDPRAGFIAYVPHSSIEKGKELVHSGGGGVTLQCAICHGPYLNGIANIPGIAARSPSYMARQLNDMKQGARKGTMSALMAPVVQNLTSEDILNIVAYTASLSAPLPEHEK